MSEQIVVSLRDKEMLQQALRDVPAGAKGQAGVTVTHRGVEASVGATLLQRTTFTVTGAGFASRLWGGSWEYGARAQVVWK